MSDYPNTSENDKLRKSAARWRAAAIILALLLVFVFTVLVMATSRTQTITVSPSNSSEPSRAICSAGPNGFGTGDCDLPSKSPTG